jgi:glycosyltransferase involved in cell wall biosynthesis
MKRVLIFAYYFPPMGMGGVQRIQKFVKYLPEFGWEPIVFSVRDVMYHAEDTTLLEEIKDRQIVRTESLDLLRLRKKLFRPNRVRRTGDEEGARFPENIFKRLLSWIYVPDSKIPWIPCVLPEASRLIHSRPVDLLFTSSPPLSAHLAGLFLKRRVNVPWIADFRDTVSEPHQGLTPVHRWLNQGIMRNIVRHADHIVTVSDPITRELHIQSGKSLDAFSTLPNGFDREDFAGFRKKKQKKWIWTYCGTVSSIQNPKNFLQALVEAIAACPELRKVLHVRFVGAVIGVPLKQFISRLKLQDIVESIGYVSHRESIRFLMESDMLLLLLDEKLSPGMVTGKVFEYLASGKPILAAVPKGEAERLIIRFARGVVVPPANVDTMTRQILRCYTLWKRGDLKVSVERWKGLEVFDRRNQAGELARIFNGVMGEKCVCFPIDNLLLWFLRALWEPGVRRYASFSRQYMTRERSRYKIFEVNLPRSTSRRFVSYGEAYLEPSGGYIFPEGKIFEKYLDKG